LGRATAVQLAGTAANRVTPAGTGGLALNVAHLACHDVQGPDAAAAIAVRIAAGVVGAALVTAVAVGALGAHGGGLPDVDDAWPLVVIPVALVVVTLAWRRGGAAAPWRRFWLAVGGVACDRRRALTSSSGP
jgi:hypothetical protein